VNGLLAELQAAVRGEQDKVPAGWKTRTQMARDFGKSLVTTDRLIKAGEETGILERRDFRIAAKPGYVRAQPHWRRVRR